MKAFTDSYLIDNSENEFDLAKQGLQPRSQAATDWTVALTEEEKERLWRIRVARAAVKRSDDVPLPESGHFYNALESRIMQRVAMIQEQRVCDRIEKLCETETRVEVAVESRIGRGF